MFPISDDNPTRTRPYLTWSLMGVNILVFLWQLTLPEKALTEVVHTFGMVPAVLFGLMDRPAELPDFPPVASVFTSMFLHGSPAHLAGNMLFLWIFGDNVEDALGRVRFLAFYFLAGIAAALMQGVLDPASQIPMIGASGAISGVLGAYILLYPFANVRTVIFLGFLIQVIRVPALWVLGLWFVVQLVLGLIPSGDEGGVAFWAHIGGFLAGLGLLPLMRPRRIALFQARRSPAWSREDPGRFGPWGRRW